MEFLNGLIDPFTNYLLAHPKLLALMVVVVVIHTAVKAFVDSLVSSRAQWDKTPDVDETPWEKALTIAVRVLAVTGKAVAYMAGFRPKSKAEIVVEKR
jgi:hypothetical protein